MGAMERGTRQVRATVIPNVKRETLQKKILEQVGFGATVYTDGWPGFDGLKTQHIHETVNHIEEYVRGQVSTQAIENFWSCLKRTLNGTYVAVEPFHMDRYLDEQMFRFNNRIGHTDGTLFQEALTQVGGKRLTWVELTGKQSSQLPKNGPLRGRKSISYAEKVFRPWLEQPYPGFRLDRRRGRKPKLP